MSKIKILPEILSNKIAAGEVVERPASVVKELVENALDAESTAIAVEVERGGRSLIRVSDNGTGMTRDDAMLSIERYATSKIYRDADLFSIRTLGFRGEALPSIAAVSRFSLITRERGADSGVSIHVSGGKLEKISEAGAPPGTMVTAKQLFFNTPARRKFLKTVETEMGHIADTLARIALNRPEIHFRLLHDGRPVKDLPAVDQPLDRIVEILGKDLQHDLYPLSYEDGGLSIRGWAGNAVLSRRTSRGIYIYINGRWVHDPIVQHGIVEGYSGRLMKGQFPAAVLSIRVPFEEVDVNVHPTKDRVRFSSASRVHDAVKAAISGLLREHDRTFRMPKERSGSSVSEGVRPYSGSYAGPDTRSSIGPARSPVGPGSSRRNEEPGCESKNLQSRTETEEQKRLWDRKPYKDLRFIGQLHRTYIVCESAEGLVLVDQHAAHERIRFEQLKRMADRFNQASQKCLVAETLDLSYAEAETTRRLIPELSRFGLEIEPFGGNTFAVKAVPALLKGAAIRPLILEIIDTATELGIKEGMEKAIDACLVVMACHGTLRSGQEVSDEEIKKLFLQLGECENPSYCPHGRPIRVEWPLRDLEKSFRRIT
jgi:DNA mismatch repair protein MutL